MEQEVGGKMWTMTMTIHLKYPKRAKAASAAAVVLMVSFLDLQGIHVYL
jgi:hypothetical protein